MNKDEFKQKVQKVIIDDASKPKTTIKPSIEEIKEIEKMWKKFHEELLKRVEKKSEE